MAIHCISPTENLTLVLIIKDVSTEANRIAAIAVTMAQSARETSARAIRAGAWKSGELLGVCRYVSGAVYEGSWMGGKKEGQGVYRYTNGDVYEGSWKNDSKEGQGVMHYGSGAVYEGSWEDGKKEGQGVYR